MQYTGGKQKIAKELAAVISSYKPSVYWEPFCGAANVIQHVKAPVRIGSDRDPHIVSYLQLIQSGWFPPNILVSDEAYRSWRNCKPETHEQFAIRAIIGYGCSFGGRFFQGLARDTRKNTSNSYYETAQIASKKQAPLLSNIQFYLSDFWKYFPAGCDLIYCDPPYKGTTSAGSINKFNHDFFWSWAHLCAASGVRVLVSEFQAPSFAREIWRKEKAADLRRNDGSLMVERLFEVTV